MGPKPACFGAFSTTFRFPKLELPSTYGHAMPKIYLFWRISAGPIKMYILENLNQISGKLEIHTKTQKCTYFGENIYFLQEKKKNLCFISEKSTHKRKLVIQRQKKCIFWSIQGTIKQKKTIRITCGGRRDYKINT